MKLCAFLWSSLLLGQAALTLAATARETQSVELRYLNLDPVARAKKPIADASDFSALATLTYSPVAPHNAKLKSTKLPPNNTDFTTVAFFDPQDPKKYRSTTTATCGFHKPYSGRFRILLSVDGTQVLSASYHSYLAAPAAKAKPKANGKQKDEEDDFDIVFQTKAPGVFIDKPEQKVQKSIGIGMPEEVNEDGEKVEEKTFFQKYWWLLLAALVVSLLGPGGDK